jgi:hypothetical protein
MLPIERHTLHFTARRAGHLPEFLGSSWRGAFGRALRQQVCLTGMDRCPPCPLYRRCAYPYLFETPPPDEATVLRKYPHAPHPYILYSQTSGGSVAQGQPLMMDVTLIGRGIEHRSVVLSAIEQAAARGLGRAQLPLALESASKHPIDASPPPVPASIRVQLESPLRLMIDNLPVHPDRFNFGDFFSVLLRRVAMLHAFHADAPLDLDFRRLVDLARAQPATDPHLRWDERQRYSSRQGRTVPLGGLTGSFELHGALAPFWPILWQGQWLHLGKATVMGLGRYRLEAPG